MRFALLAMLPAAGLVGVASAQGLARGEPDFDAFYDLGPDSLVRRGVPKGEIEGPFKLPTDVFPGTDQDCWVYDTGGAMLPEMMRWLWRDHPVSVDPVNTTERSFRE